LTRLERFGLWRREWLFVTYLLALGLMCDVFSGAYLLNGRWASATWRPVAEMFWMFACAFSALWFLLNFPEFPDPDRPSPPGDLWGFLFAVGAVLGFLLRTHVAAAPVVCMAAVAYMWLVGRVRRRSCLIAAAGWLCAGIFPLMVPWPNEQRFVLGILLGGLATALQGVVDVVAFLIGRRPEWSQPTTDPAERICASRP
jgi:hypothetical protein